MPIQRTAPGSRPLWSNRPFRALWGSIGISLVGSEITLLALPLTAVVVLDASALQVALLAAAGTAPFLMLGLPAGAWVDRLPRRGLMISGDLLRGLLLATIPLAYVVDALTLVQLYVIAFGVGSCSVLFDVAALSTLPALVPGPLLAQANSSIEAIRATAQTSGPAAAGTLVQIVGAPIAIALDAASYVLSAVVLRGLPSTPPALDGESPKLVPYIREGLRFCLRHPYVRPLALGAAWINFWTEAVLAVFITHAVRNLDLSAIAIGGVLAAANLGYLTGSVLVPRLNASLGVARTIVLGVCLNIGLVVVALAPSHHTLAWLLVGFTLHTAASALWNVNAVSLRQASTPAAMLARMNASNRFLIWGTMPLGAATGGLLALVVGLHTAVLVAAVCVPLCAVPLARSGLRHVFDMPADLPADVGATVPA